MMKLPLLSLKEKTQDNEFEQNHHVVCNLHCVRIFICDDQLRILDITPVLGRAYSVGTNRYQSTCLIVNEVTTPSYNYDFTFTDFSKKTEGGNNVEYSVKLALKFVYVSIIAKGDYKVARK